MLTKKIFKKEYVNVHSEKLICQGLRFSKCFIVLSLFIIDRPTRENRHHNIGAHGLHVVQRENARDIPAR